MSLVKRIDDGRVELRSPTAAPQATAFLWNRHMLAQVNCRGFVRTQYMHPEPVAYSHGPTLEATTFMQPEMPLYAHHPGRFVYIRDEASETVFSVPYEPARNLPSEFVFSAGDREIEWRLQQDGISATWSLALPDDSVAELWTLEVRNDSDTPRELGLYPLFSIGFMSWMNQSASYDSELGGIVARCVSPYQKVEDYDRVCGLKDCTVLLHDSPPIAWESSLAAFEGEGGLSSPDGVRAARLGCGDAIYELPCAALQYRVSLKAGQSRQLRFVFAPAADDDEIAALRERFLSPTRENRDASRHDNCINVSTPDADFDHFVNHWLGRQVEYLGKTHRWTTDPQTRNLLQDQMGMAYLDPDSTREAFLTALAQQNDDGSMPDGIVLNERASLKYINQVPHTDHNVWLPVCLQPYLDESGDYALLDEVVAGSSVFERVTRAMEWLDGNRDDRGLSLIAQGDWCDPMNMAGHLGRGVSGWLTIATAHATRLWAGIATRAGHDDVSKNMLAIADDCCTAAQRYLWDGEWFARGISDNGLAFGVAADAEGRIFLNPQSWALMAGLASGDQADKLTAAVSKHLDTPFGLAMLHPPYTRMQEHIGRLTQKHPGSAENGAVYNHAATFMIHALYRQGRGDEAFAYLRKMVPCHSDHDFGQRRQLPVFVPNYYRGAVDMHPRTAGRSSQLPNTGAASWLYRIIIEQLFGLRGSRDGLTIDPSLPGDWPGAEITRYFRGATFNVVVERTAATAPSVTVDGKRLSGKEFTGLRAGHTHNVHVALGPPAMASARQQED